MKVSINEQIINKNENGANQSKGFKPADLTPQELANCISKGYAFSYQFEKAHRKADNFICSDIIAADFDSGMTLDEAFNNEFFINNASILYTTASDQSTAVMDIDACHSNGCSLQLDKLLNADDANFAHDVFGIRRFIDRTTGKLDGCFLPRSAARFDSPI